MNFIFLDTGKGIPATVNKTYKEQVKQIFVPQNIKEGDILRSAFEGHFRSRTEQENRGRGLPQIYELMHEEYIKYAAVYSGKAVAAISLSQGNLYCSLNDSFYGTLYEFTIQGV